MKSTPYLLILLFIGLIVINLFGQSRPNIVWIVSEDNSVHYSRLYEKSGAPMPTIEKLAKQGLVFNHAFSNAPVCSVARSTIISGCYAPRVGAQYHRRSELAPLPPDLKMFPQYLREAGYYTTNNSKEDYNFIKGAEVWDESSQKASFRNRKEGQSFFHVQNFGVTHEGQLHFSEEKMENTKTENDQESVRPFPYHPNTPTFRYTYAKYLDHHQRVDQQIGQFLQQLEEDGLMDETIIFYYGDHGGVLPRSKGYIYESGLHVPMVVYAAEKWKHLLPAARGSRIDGFVQFVDLGPTVLNLAGLSVPAQMDGAPFLGKGVNLAELNKRNTTFSYADRFDEKYDLVRAVRKGKYKYMRNFQPFNFDGLYNFYRYKMLAYQEWRELYKAGKLNAAQRQFFESRPAECLYDIEKDPHEINNLANDPAYAAKLKELRKALQKQLKIMPDLSFYPENKLMEEAWKNPVPFGQTHKKDISKLTKVADLSLRPFSKVEKKIAKALRSADPWRRYWALIVCSSFGEEAAVFYEEARQMAAADTENLVRLRAAEFLALNGAENPAPVIAEALKAAKTPVEANLMLNTVALIHAVKPEYKIEVKKSFFKSEWYEDNRAVFLRRLEYFGAIDQ